MRTFQRLATKPYELILSGYGSDYIDDYDWLNFQFSATSDFHHIHWKDDKYESLVNQAAVDADQNKRIQLYQQAEAIFMNAVPAIRCITRHLSI